MRVGGVEDWRILAVAATRQGGTDEVELTYVAAARLQRRTTTGSATRADRGSCGRCKPWVDDVERQWRRGTTPRGRSLGASLLRLLSGRIRRFCDHDYLVNPPSPPGNLSCLRPPAFVDYLAHSTRQIRTPDPGAVPTDRDGGGSAGAHAQRQVRKRQRQSGATSRGGLSRGCRTSRSGMPHQTDRAAAASARAGRVATCRACPELLSVIPATGEHDGLRRLTVPVEQHLCLNR